MYSYLRTHSNISDLAQKTAKEIVTKVDLNKFVHKRTKKELVECVALLIDIITSRYKEIDHKFFLAPQNVNLFSRNPLFSKYNFSTYKTALNIMTKYKVIYLDQKGSPQLNFNNDSEFKFQKGLVTIYGINELSEWDFNLTMLEKVQMLFKKKKSYDAIIKAKGDKKEILGKIKDKDVRYINKNLREMGYPEFQYHRVFQNDTDKCGRVYNVLQTIKKEEREKLYKEQGWIEVDFHAMGPNSIYRLKTGGVYQGEMYNDILAELNIDPEYWIPYRYMIKRMFILVLNTGSKDQALKAIRQALCIKYGVYDKLDIKLVNYFFNKKFLIDNNFDINTKRYIFSPEDIISAFESVHHKIVNQFYACSYQLTQYIESNIAIRVMKYLVFNNIIPLSIHDCFVVPLYFEKKVRDYMEYVFPLEVIKEKERKKRIPLENPERREKRKKLRYIYNKSILFNNKVIPLLSGYKQKLKKNNKSNSILNKRDLLNISLNKLIINKRDLLYINTISTETQFIDVSCNRYESWHE